MILKTGVILEKQYYPVGRATAEIAEKMGMKKKVINPSLLQNSKYPHPLFKPAVENFFNFAVCYFKLPYYCAYLVENTFQGIIYERCYFTDGSSVLEIARGNMFEVYVQGPNALKSFSILLEITRSNINTRKGKKFGHGLFELDKIDRGRIQQLIRNLFQA